MWYYDCGNSGVDVGNEGGESTTVWHCRHSNESVHGKN